jgi:signal peptidase I
MEADRLDNSSRALAVPEIKADAVYVGEDLHIDLWVRPKKGHPKSILIRSVNAEGEMMSSLLHITDEVRIIPNYTDDVALNKKEAKAKFQSVGKKVKKVKKGLARKVLNWAGSAFVIASILAFVTGALQARVVLTGSMKPQINPGDLVIAESTQFLTPKVGDVALYSARDLQGKPVSTWAHRVIAGDATHGYTFKGDANAAPDLGNPTIKDVHSVVLFKIPAIGRFLNPLVVILLGSGLMALVYAIGLIRRDRNA